MYVDKWFNLQEPGTEDYNTGLIMKAIVLRYKSSFQTNFNERLKSLHDALTIVEAFSDTPKGFFVNMHLLILMHECYRGMNYQKAAEFVKKANELYMRYTKNCNELIWNFHCICTGVAPSVESSNITKISLKNHLGYILYIHYTNEYNEASEFKYAVSALRYLESARAPAHRYGVLTWMYKVSCIFLKCHRLKQLDHCLAGLMFHLTKYRGFIPESQHYKVSEIQAQVAKLFTLWGICIAKNSMIKISTGIGLPIDNDSYDEIDMFQETGVEAYTAQFPIELVKTLDEVKAVIKRVKAWRKKTDELLGYVDSSRKWESGGSLVAELEEMLTLII